MPISNFEHLMRDCGVAEPLVATWRDAAAQLPAMAAPPVIAGLSKMQALVLLSRILRRIAAAAGLDFSHPDIIGNTGIRLVGPFPQERAGAQSERRSVPRRLERRTGDIWDGAIQRSPQEPGDRRRGANVIGKMASCHQERRIDDNGHASPQQNRSGSRSDAVRAEKNH